MHRVPVMPRCSPPCAACDACRTDTPVATLAQVLSLEHHELLLGGGDAARWPALPALLAENRRLAEPRRYWLEAPAASLPRERLHELAALGLHGVLVQIEGTGPKLLKVMNSGDGELAIQRAEAAGLAASARFVARPKTLPLVAPLAARLAPRQVWLELVRQEWSGEFVPIWPDAISKLLLACQNLSFSGHRKRDAGYLPPCVLPAVWAARPTAFRGVIATAPEEENRSLAACPSCSLRTRCAFRDRAALTPEARESAQPITDETLPWDKPRATQLPVPHDIVRRRTGAEIVCTTPWTTMEVVDPNGKVRQCCSTWTHGDRGSLFEGSLRDVWNGAGYRSARRQMAGADLGELCLPICSRLHDKKFREAEFTIQTGSERFVKNQLAIAEDIAERRDTVTSMPLRLALCPSTYCNYNCIMCDHGRSPRRELPPEIWQELPDFLPTLQSLTLLGGEPLANPHTMRFLREFDVAKYPDCAVDFVTNGSLLTPSVLARLGRCTLGDVTLSLNAGTPDVYARVQRGIEFESVLANLDALIRFRSGHHRWFGITASFVVQPASAATLIAFGELAHARNLRIRLMALNPENHEGLDFYTDPDTVLAVVREVDRFEAWSARVRPEWLREIRAARSALIGEAELRRAPQNGEHVRLPLLA